VCALQLLNELTLDKPHERSKNGKLAEAICREIIANSVAVYLIAINNADLKMSLCAI
jgi:hypothetical protein